MTNPTNRRNLFFGEASTSNAVGNNLPQSGAPRYVVTRPGLVGVCEQAFSNAGFQHVHPCLSDGDCPGATNDCVCPPDAGSACSGSGTGNWKRCVNQPWKRCGTDGDCAWDGFAQFCLVDDCFPPDVVSALDNVGLDGARPVFKDFIGKPCERRGATNAEKNVQCVPAGVCAPLILKAKDNSISGNDPVDIDELHDLGWNPDEQAEDPHGEPLELTDRMGTDYATSDPGQGETLLETLADCIETFSFIEERNMDETGRDTWEDRSGKPGQCPAELANWIPSPGAGVFWWDEDNL